MYRFKEILIIEDQGNSDVSMIKEAFNLLKTNYKLKFISDGIEAIRFLNQEAENNLVNQSLILLGLDLPGKSGYEVLKEIKQNEKLRHIPVIIINSSYEQIDNLYIEGANSVIEKPKDFESLVVIIKEIEEFWLKTSQLPNF